MLNLEALNEAQLRAVTYGEGPLLVLAGPGSGKTFTLTQRINYLIEVMHVAPEQILVITFTKDAALSMQKRFTDQSAEYYPVHFGTFHSVFYQILKQSKPFRATKVLTESQKRNLIFPVLKQLYRQLKKADPTTEEAGLFLMSIGYYKNTKDMVKAVEKLPEDMRSYFKTIFEGYEAAKRASQALDFDDMLYECESMLRTDVKVRKAWSNRFSHILMDEFQDINPLQFQIITLLSKEPHNLFAVGDDDQSIYGFRGSEPACLKAFEKTYQAKRILLNINYRSAEPIVKASLQVIACNKQRFSKDLKAHLNGTDGVCLKGFEEQEEEYAYLADCLEKWEKESVAVLFRTNAHMQSFAIRLQKRGIRYEMKEKSTSIYEHILIKDIMAYLRIAGGEASRGLCLQIINKPARYINREAFAEFAGDWEKVKAYYRRAKEREEYRMLAIRSIHEVENLEQHLKRMKKMSPYLAVQYVCKIIGYEAYALQGKVAGVRCRTVDEKEKIQTLFQWIKSDALQYESVEAWIRAQQEYNQVLQVKKQIGQSEETDVVPVQLMTVHASKGLEFDRVYIPDCNERIFPNGSMQEEKSIEEERRIFYVAMTRAKKHLELLYVTGSKERPRLISRFLNPLLKD